MRLSSEDEKMEVTSRRSPSGQPIVARLLTGLMMVALVAWFIVELYPVLFLLNTSLKTDSEILNAPFALPTGLNFWNYVSVWAGEGANNRPMALYMRNSIVVTVGTLALLLAVSSLAGYALARGRFPGSAATQQTFLLCLAVPVHVLIIPVFFMMDRFGLRNDLLGLTLMYTTMGVPFTVLLMRAYFLSFPVEMEEAAQIDGCSRFGVFWRVVIPVSRNAIASMAIINVSWVWSELFFALVLMDRSEAQTMPLAVIAYAPKAMMGESTIGPQFAAMVSAALPLILVYFLFQQQITKGMTMGAIR